MLSPGCSSWGVRLWGVEVKTAPRMRRRSVRRDLPTGRTAAATRAIWPEHVIVDATQTFLGVHCHATAFLLVKERFAGQMDVGVRVHQAATIDKFATRPVSVKAAHRLATTGNVAMMDVKDRVGPAEPQTTAPRRVTV